MDVNLYIGRHFEFCGQLEFQKPIIHLVQILLLQRKDHKDSTQIIKYEILKIGQEKQFSYEF